MEYLFANDSGEVVEVEYDNLSNKINRTNIVDEIKKLYFLNGKNVEVTRVNGVYDVFQINFNDSNIEYIIAKETTPGGRNGLKDEQRIQVNGSSFNFLYNKACEGLNTAVLGFYNYFDKMVITSWMTTDSTSNSPVSKQIKIDCISESIQVGFSQYKQRNNNVFYCSFIPEFFNFYMKYKDILHISKFEDIKLYKEEITLLDNAIDKPHQRIFFGAPGTGKSYELNRQAKEYFGNNYDRVTFHPNYMYGNFVGAFKPFPKVLKNGNGEIKKDEDGNIQETITYDYIPGILMKQLIKAFINPNINYLVLIEEINRANVAAVFGDIFQLLDRKSNGESEYFIATSRELQEFLKKEFSSIPLSDEIKEKLGDNFENLYLPKNLYIWATMNSADQGVMPMDTAFRRRWEFEYLGINVAADTNKEEFEKYKFKINSTEIVLWDVFRRELNKKLSLLNIPEDKLIGPYFISKSMLEETDLDKLTDTIKNKVLMYLYEDAAKAYKSSLFAEGKYATYSSVCKYFDENALTLFKGNFDIETELINAKVSDEESIDSEE